MPDMGPPPGLRQGAGGEVGRSAGSDTGVDHEFDNGLVGLPHAVGGQLADVADGVLHAFDQNAVSAVELAAVHLHLHSQQACLHR